MVSVVTSIRTAWWEQLLGPSWTTIFAETEEMTRQRSHLINILRGQWQEKENKLISSLVSTQRVVPQTGVGGGQQLIGQADKADDIMPLDQQTC